MTKKPESPAENTTPQRDDRVQVVNKSKRYISIPIAQGVNKTLGPKIDEHMVKVGKGHPHKVILTQAQYSFAMKHVGVQGLFDANELQSIARA